MSISTVLRQAVSVEISLSNPLQEELRFQVFLQVPNISRDVSIPFVHSFHNQVHQMFQVLSLAFFMTLFRPPTGRRAPGALHLHPRAVSQFDLHPLLLSAAGSAPFGEHKVRHRSDRGVLVPSGPTRGSMPSSQAKYIPKPSKNPCFFRLFFLRGGGGGGGVF